jgi:hypothetical protein
MGHKFGTILLGDDYEETERELVYPDEECYAVEEGFEYLIRLKIRKSWKPLPPPLPYPGAMHFTFEAALAVSLVAYSDKLCLPADSVQESDEAECSFRARTKGEAPMQYEGQDVTNATDITIDFLYKCKAGPCKCGECLSSPPPYGEDICKSEYRHITGTATHKGAAIIDPTQGVAPYNQPGSTFPCCFDYTLGPSGGTSWCDIIFHEPGIHGGDYSPPDSPIANVIKEVFDEAMDSVNYCCEGMLPTSGKEAYEAFQDAWDEASHGEDCTSA